LKLFGFQDLCRRKEIKMENKYVDKHGTHEYVLITNKLNI